MAAVSPWGLPGSGVWLPAGELVPRHCGLVGRGALQAFCLVPPIVPAFACESRSPNYFPVVPLEQMEKGGHGSMGPRKDGAAPNSTHVGLPRSPRQLEGHNGISGPLVFVQPQTALPAATLGDGGYFLLAAEKPWQASIGPFGEVLEKDSPCTRCNGRFDSFLQGSGKPPLPSAGSGPEGRFAYKSSAENQDFPLKGPTLSSCL